MGWSRGPAGGSGDEDNERSARARDGVGSAMTHDQAFRLTETRPRVMVGAVDRACTIRQCQMVLGRTVLPLL